MSSPICMLSLRPLRLVGRVSFRLYIWHFPAFWAASPWASDINWFPRAMATCAVLAICVFAAHRFIERPVSSWLGRGRLTSAAAADADASAVPAVTAL